MKLVATALFPVFFIVVLGCDTKDYAVAPVAGSVMHDGKPVSNLRVTFSPLSIGQEHAVGPYSTGETDSDGKFSLITRYKDDGAFVGKHSLKLVYSDVSATAMAELRSAMGEAKETGSKENFEEAKKRISEMKAKLKGRPVLKSQYRKVIEVPADGLQDLQLELTELK